MKATAATASAQPEKAAEETTKAANPKVTRKATVFDARAAAAAAAPQGAPEDAAVAAATERVDRRAKLLADQAKALAAIAADAADAAESEK